MNLVSSLHFPYRLWFPSRAEPIWSQPSQPPATPSPTISAQQLPPISTAIWTTAAATTWCPAGYAETQLWDQPHSIFTGLHDEKTTAAATTAIATTTTENATTLQAAVCWTIWGKVYSFLLFVLMLWMMKFS